MKKVRCNKANCNQFAVKQFGFCQIHWMKQKRKRYISNMTAFIHDVALEMRIAQDLDRSNGQRG